MNEKSREKRFVETIKINFLVMTTEKVIKETKVKSKFYWLNNHQPPSDFLILSDNLFMDSRKDKKETKAKRLLGKLK